METLSSLLALILTLPPAVLPPAEVSFQDGGLVKMSIKEKSLDMQTKYGKLAMPLADIRHIDFGKTDTVQTAEGPIMGSVLNTTIRAHSPYFGDVVLKRADLRAIRLRVNSGIEIEKVIEANDSWTDTGLTVAKGDRFAIMTIGAVDLWPQTPGQYMATARGLKGMQGKNSPHLAGTLVGKIGEKIFAIGERWEGEMETAGKLLLSIVLPPWETIPQGNYRVTIKGTP